MALDGSALIEQTQNYDRTREQRCTEALRAAQQGRVMDISIINDLLNILTDVDNYAKGVTTGMAAIQTNYNTMKAKPMNKLAGH